MSRFATTRDDKSSLQDLLQVMVSPDEYRKKFAEMCELEVELDKKIAQVAIADEILMVREHAHQDRAKAKQELEDAQSRCTALEQKAVLGAQGIIEQANLTRANLVKEGNDLLKEAKAQADAYVDNANMSVDNMRALIKRQQEELAQARHALAEQQKTLDEKCANCDLLKAQLEANIAEQQELKNDAQVAAARYTNLHARAMDQLEALRGNLLALYAKKL